LRQPGSFNKIRSPKSETAKKEQEEEMKHQTADVLVVGCGPAGLTAALALAQLGVDVLAVAKHSGTAHSPRAHITNQRTMEVFRHLGVEPQVREAAIPNELMGENVWSTSFAAPELARLRTWGTGDDRRSEYEAASPCAMCNIAQHILEPILLREAISYGARIQFRHEFVSLVQNEDGVETRLRHRDSGEEILVRSRYVIGADGANSVVAKAIDVSFCGEMGLGASANAWIEADLSRYCARRPSVLYWMNRPGNAYWVGSGTYICVKPWNEWVLLFMYDPDGPEPDLSDEAIIARARTTIGDDSIKVRVKAVSKWQINHVVAEQYQKGRVFIAGDAAHRHPPANGLGTNTSVQDSFNLAWKLAAVIKGVASPALLRSYETERQPVGRQVVDRAMKSVADMRPISDAFGFRPGQSEEDGWKSLAVLASNTDEGRRRRGELAEAVALQNYQFNAHGVEMGQLYVSDAVVGDGSPPSVPDKDSELFYQPTSYPGARLPHAWLERSGKKLSSIDLCRKDGFVLLTGIGGDDWLEAAKQVSVRFNVPIGAYRVGLGCEVLDVLGDWTRLRGVEDAGCVLVRPDLHVAWRCARSPADPAAVLTSTISAILHSTPTPSELVRESAACDV
jgi:2,4-dichlorophenol 6-monooxygenase